MLNINFFNATINNAETLNFASAIRFEYLTMENTLFSGKVQALNKKLEQASQPDAKKTPEQIQAIRDDIAELEKAISENDSVLSDIQETHDCVVTNMVNAGNKYSNVVNVLRITAAAENPKLFTYALNFKGQEVNLENLRQIMDRIHVLSDCNEVGQSKTKKADYESACNELNKFVLYNFSLNAETVWTCKKSVRLNKTDYRAFNESYVRSANYEFKTDKKSGTTDCKGMKYNTLVSEKTTKKSGTVTDYSKLAAWICRMVAGKLSK